MTAQLRQQVVLKTGYSYRYVCCVIDPNDKRYNEQVVEVCENGTQSVLLSFYRTVLMKNSIFVLLIISIIPKMNSYEELY